MWMSLGGHYPASHRLGVRCTPAPPYNQNPQGRASGKERVKLGRAG